MKILRIIPSMKPEKGGPCQGIRNAIPELINLGITNEVVCLDAATSSYLGQDSFVIHALGEAKTPWQYNKNLLPWLIKNHTKYDAIIIHGLWLYHSHAAIKAFNTIHKNSPKIFVMPHGMLDPYFQKAGSRKLKALRNDIYWKLIENNVVNKADGILFTCEEELLLARTTFPNYKPKKEINVGYGIQPPPAYKSEMREAFAKKVSRWNGKRHLLFLSRIHLKKGVDLLIKAYLKLEQELDNLPQLVIAGPGLEDGYGTVMQELASSSKNILFPGMLKGNAKWGAFYESEVFILPSHQENFGIAVVEALACTKPVLISNKVNIWREIETENGGIVKQDTENDTYNLLKEWITFSDTQKLEMSKNAFKVYENYFTVAKAAQQFLSGINYA
ncbi:glycosyltransferase involved in cell wall biosynthesis [Maribacter spongiicola]|uniref:Glycosyltransferase involved in cell wall biosynthesis n=1 Tax=Maribacter spongiicola TaxID=1206753 RepID=A0A4R7K644_9FLAO|nr:glycosyltransferase [Maribacter spongiicola]TDT46727.1 glycosyltransferase involved in cell wall biosynthesis [Maribacter spongiicola]